MVVRTEMLVALEEETAIVFVIVVVLPAVAEKERDAGDKLRDGGVLPSSELLTAGIEAEHADKEMTAIVNHSLRIDFLLPRGEGTEEKDTGTTSRLGPWRPISKTCTEAESHEGATAAKAGTWRC